MLYNCAMKKTKEFHFSQARQKLSAIVDEVEKTGKPVTILRHGKPAAVVISPVEYQMKFGQKGEWKLAGSLKAVKGVDIEKAIKESRAEGLKAWEKNMARLAKELAED